MLSRCDSTYLYTLIEHVVVLCLQGSRDPDQVGSQQSCRLVEPGRPHVRYDDRISKLELRERIVITYKERNCNSSHIAPLNVIFV